jgi:hypothetical protein
LTFANRTKTPKEVYLALQKSLHIVLMAQNYMHFRGVLIVFCKLKNAIWQTIQTTAKAFVLRLILRVTGPTGWQRGDNCQPQKVDFVEISRLIDLQLKN